MGLDMYLESEADIKSIKWATDKELKKEFEFDREVIITFTNNKERKLYAWYISKITFIVPNTNNTINTISVRHITNITNTEISLIYYRKDTDMVIHYTIPINNIISIRYTHAYWRKANMIHKWFVDNVQGGIDNCNVYSVSVEKLKELKKLCREVIKTNNVSLLPTQSGFFFGSTNYDNYYYSDLKSTIKQLSNLNSKHTYYYSSSF